MALPASTPSTNWLKTFEVPVVFITAYPERFLTGERPEPAFLISKPFQPAMVSAVASQAAVLPAQFAQPRAEGGSVLNRGSLAFCVQSGASCKGAPDFFRAVMEKDLQQSVRSARVLNSCRSRKASDRLDASFERLAATADAA